MNTRRGAARSASSSPDPLNVCRRILAASVMATLLVVLMSLPLVAGVREGGDGLALYCQMANPATFRDASQFSHFERAQALTLWLEDVKSVPASLRQDLGAADLVREARQYSDEVALLGADAAELQRAPETWTVTPGHARLLAGEGLEAWAWDQDATLAAFWTDPGSPVLRLAASFESSMEPGSSQPRHLLTSALDDGSSSPRGVEFLSSSPGDLEPVALAPLSTGPVSDTMPAVVLGPSALAEMGLEALPTGAPAYGGTARAPAMASGLLSLAPLHVHDQAPTMLWRDAQFRVSAPRGQWQARPTRMLGELPAAGDGYAEMSRSSLRLAVRGTQDVLGSVAAMRGMAVNPSNWQATAGLPFVSAREALVSRNWALQGAGLEIRASSRVGVALRLDELAALRGLEGLTAGGGGPNLRMQGAGVNLDYSVTENLRLQGGYIYQRTQGLYLPSLSASPSGAFSLVDERAYPYVGFNYRFNDDARWNFNVRFYNPADLGQGSLARTQPSLFDPKVTTELRLRF